MARFPLDERYYQAAQRLGIKNPERMNRDMLMRTLGALTADPSTSVPKTIASGFRSNEDQKRAIASVARRNNIPMSERLFYSGIKGMAAPVGRSKHQLGKAVDISERQIGQQAAGGLYSRLAHYGLKQPLPNSDRNHIELDDKAMGPFPAPNLEAFIEGQPMKPVPNAAGAARRDIDERIVRDEAGNVVGLRTGGQADDFLTDWAQARMQVAGSGERPKLSTGELIGGALQAISVPIAYAQGNNAYANAMLGNGILDRHLASVAEFDKSQAAAFQKARMGNIDTMGEYGLEFSEQQQKARQQAEELVARYGEAGMPRARAILRSVGLDEGVLGGGSAQSQRQAPDPTPQISGNTAVPGIGVAQGGVQAPDVANLPTDAAGAPAPVQGAAPAAPQMPAEYAQAEAQANALRRQAETARIYDDEKGAKALEDQAKRLEEVSGLEEYRKQQAKDRVASEKSARELEKEMPSIRRKYETSLELTSTPLQILDRLIEKARNPATGEDSYALSPGARANFGAIDQYVPNVFPQSLDAQADIDQLRGILTVESLQQLKDKAGSIGTITEREWPMIASLMGSLPPSMSDPKALSTLLEVRDRLKRTRDREVEEFREKYGEDLVPPERTSTREMAPRRTSDGGMQQPPPATSDTLINQARAAAIGDTVTFGDQQMVKVTRDGQVGYMPYDQIYERTARGTRVRPSMRKYLGG